MKQMDLLKKKWKYLLLDSADKNKETTTKNTLIFGMGLKMKLRQ